MTNGNEADAAAQTQADSNSHNPLIYCIRPCPKTLAELYKAVSAAPLEDFNPEIRKADKLSRLLGLDSLEEIYVPTSRDMRSAVSVLRMLLSGYKRRSPNAAYWRQHRPQCDRLSTVSTHLPFGNASAASIAIVGVSGSGKSTFIENLLGSIPQEIKHRQEQNSFLPGRQVVWIKVTCPVNRTPRAFIKQFFTEIDGLIGTAYSTAFMRQNDDELIVSMAKIARTHFLGVLVIDEIQNVVSKSKDADRRLLKLFVNIAGTLHVPIVFVGTPKSQEILNAELADARRMLGPKWLPFSPHDPDWTLIIDALWARQYTRTETPLDDTLRAEIYKYTQGIPALAKALYGLVQDRIIMNSKKDDPETITTTLLKQTFDEDMQSVHGAVNALRTNSGFEVYDDLFPKELPKFGSHEKENRRVETLAREFFEDSLLRASRKEAKMKAAELFSSSGQ